MSTLEKGAHFFCVLPDSMIQFLRQRLQVAKELLILLIQLPGINQFQQTHHGGKWTSCLLYTSDAADE